MSGGEGDYTSSVSRGGVTVDYVIRFIRECEYGLWPERWSGASRGWLYALLPDFSHLPSSGVGSRSSSEGKYLVGEESPSENEHSVANQRLEAQRTRHGIKDNPRQYIVGLFSR